MLESVSSKEELAKEGRGDLQGVARQPGETARAYAVFRQFLELGPTRSLRQLASQAGRKDKPPSVPGRLGLWSRKWRWMSRAEQYDECLQAIQNDAARVEAEREAAKRAKQKEEAQQKIIGYTMILIDRIGSHVERPAGDVRRVTDKHGNKTTIVDQRVSHLTDVAKALQLSTEIVEKLFPNKSEDRDSMRCDEQFVISEVDPSNFTYEK